MVRQKRKTRAASAGQRRRRREEQLELDLSPRADRVTPATPDLRGTSRMSPMTETQTKRLRNGVLVQQMLR